MKDIKKHSFFSLCFVLVDQPGNVPHAFTKMDDWFVFVSQAEEAWGWFKSIFSTS